MVNPPGVEVVCVVLGIMGLVWFFGRERRKRKANNVLNRTVDPAGSTSG
jgi:hypothetical protein